MKRLQSWSRTACLPDNSRSALETNEDFKCKEGRCFPSPSLPWRSWGMQGKGLAHFRLIQARPFPPPILMTVQISKEVMFLLPPLDATEGLILGYRQYAYCVIADIVSSMWICHSLMSITSKPLQACPGIRWDYIPRPHCGYLKAWILGMPF